MAVARRRPLAKSQALTRKAIRKPTRKLRRKLPRAARYAKAVQPPDGPVIRYRVAMRQLVAQWWKRVGPQALALAKKIAKPEDRADAKDEAPESIDANLSDYSSTAEADWFTKRLGGVATDVERHSDAQFKRIGIKLKDSAPGVAKYVPKWRKENVALTKTMFKSEQAKLEALLRDGAGRTYEALAKDIEDRFDITTRHAETIARSQGNRLNSQIAVGRAQSAGVTQFVWTTAGDERVRPMHDDLDGQTFDIDDPPVTNEAGDTNLPGEDYSCRCVPYFVVPELEDDSE
ncbi:MAG TPA: minor capsid protein [Polyangiaceae bacterium]|nr:minor capsid protein [Polyangiaceae bacterium]